MTIPYYMEMSWELIDPIAHIKQPNQGEMPTLVAQEPPRAFAQHRDPRTSPAPRGTGAPRT